MNEKQLQLYDFDQLRKALVLVISSTVNCYASQDAQQNPIKNANGSLFKIFFFKIKNYAQIMLIKTLLFQ